MFGVHDYSNNGIVEGGWSLGGILGAGYATEPRFSSWFTANTKIAPINAAAHEYGHQMSAPHAGCGPNDAATPRRSGYC